MNEEDYKAVIAGYQQKSFELFNQNVVFEAQINNMKKTIETLSKELEKLKQEKTTPTKRSSKATDEF
jgi:prefoldin subunit 5